ncbi:MAG TPA: COX15/CtaA family protein [Chitinophagaceae bacterium]
MNSTAAYLRYTWFVLGMVFLVILAGGVVRMTQSGMGCPDWPTCFGRWIPPTHASQLPPDFEKYLSQQDIDHTFNVYHTWIEYINRLLGALLGVFIFIHTIWSFKKFRRSNRAAFFISLLMLLAVGFQGWLGKQVVDANLAVVKVTIHMIVALIIAALPVLIISKLKQNKTVVPKPIMTLTVVTLLLVLLQIVIGTQVREQIDEISRNLEYEQRDKWISRLDEFFLIHRSFSWIVAAGCIFLCWQTWLVVPFRRHVIPILFFLACSFAAGLLMYFMNIPAWAQPLHLLFASGLAISLFSFRLQMK